MSTKMTRESIILHYYRVEGGKVNNKDDRGGLTGRGGITKKLLDRYKRLWKKHGWSDDMDNIPYSLYEEVMTLEFWNKLWGDEVIKLSPKLVDALYGWAINSGSYYPVKAMQEHLNAMNLKQQRYPDTGIDGGMGKNTLETLQLYVKACRGRKPIKKLIGTICAAQHMHYIDISLGREKNETFTDGWLNRVMEKGERLADIR